MLYLLLAILCSSCITIVLKVGSTKEYNRYGMLCINYIICFIFAFLLMPKEIITEVLVDGKLVLMLGLLNGFLFVICMVYNQINVKKNGAIMTATFVRLGVIVPTLLSIIFFGELPSILQAIGIILVLISFFVMSKGSSNRGIHISLLLLLLLGGITDSMSKVFEQTCSMKYDDMFLFLTFFLAFIICTTICFIKKQGIHKTEIILGICMGIPNYLSTLFLLQAVSKLPAYVIYPSYSVGSIVVVSFASCFFFKEKLQKVQIISIGIIMIALFILNM